MLLSSAFEMGYSTFIFPWLVCLEFDMNHDYVVNAWEELIDKP